LHLIRSQVRIYAVKDLDPLMRSHKAANAFEAGKRLKKSKALGPGGKKAPKAKRRATD
jgi:dolichyl-diphosphooligosaccharide--protein glycosyltransferase